VLPHVCSAGHHAASLALLVTGEKG
jgi:hypothetical protein